MSFDAGFLLGLSMGGGTTKPEHDGDYQKWLDLPEPNENQAVFLVRVNSSSLRCPLMMTAYSDPVYTDAYSVDWGDGSDVEIFSSDVATFSHEYSAAGDYIITFTDNVGTKRMPMTNATNAVMIKYGKNVYDTPRYTNFNGHNILRYIRLSKNTKFDRYFFYGGYSLREIEFDGIISNIYDYMFYNCYVLKFDNLKFGDISTIPQYCFCNCYTLTKQLITNCTTIKGSAFQNCQGLREISFPNCTTIENAAFIGCRILKTAKINNCASLGDRVFSECNNLTRIAVSDECTFGTDCFYHCYCLYPKPGGST